MKARLSTDLGDPRLLKLLKAEATERETSIKEVLVTALECYFSHRIETKSLNRIVDDIFSDLIELFKRCEFNDDPTLSFFASDKYRHFEHIGEILFQFNKFIFC